VMEAFKWAPKGGGLWISNRNKSPGMRKLREHKAYAQEVAAKLVEEKKQALKDGTPQKDLLSLLGPSFISFA
jgi:hypothetical protein